MTRRIPVIATIFVAGAMAVLIGLGVWQLQRAKWKEGVLARYAQAERLPPIAWPTAGLKADELPLFRYATGMCLKPTVSRAIAGENRQGESGYVMIVQCASGMNVELGWSTNPNAKVNWAGGPVSGIIVPDRMRGMRLVAASAPPGLRPSKVPDASGASSVTPAGHRMYAATWFSLAAIALIIYAFALKKRMKERDARV